MNDGSIIVRGARQHNLKNIDVVIPRNKLVVVTGLSGSGKSSLAFDTIYAEGQRRYVESLSAYARQFLGQMDKPDVDSIEGLSPAISIDQKGAGHNPRSTVGTITEIYDYLRLLFARVGKPHCPKCGRPISAQTVDQMADQVMAMGEGVKVMVLAPLVRGRKGEHEKALDQVKKAGLVRVRVDGEVFEVSEVPRLDRNKKHNVEAVIDRLTLRPGAARRLADSLELAVKMSEGLALVVAGGRELLFSQQMACPECGVSVGELEPRLFSFNSPFGACPACSGLGTRMEVDPDLVIPDRSKSIDQGAIAPWSKPGQTYYPQLLEAVCRHFGISTRTPVKDLPPEAIRTILYGSGDEYIQFRYSSRWGRVRTSYVQFEGVLRNLERRYREASGDYAREEIEQYMSSVPCTACRGTRLRPESLAVTIEGKSIADVTAMSVRAALEFFSGLRLGERDSLIASPILKQIRERLEFLCNVGLDYLTLDRPAATLAGGEAQRIRLATQIGSALTGVLYVLDEPSVGLHQRDNKRLLDTLKKLRDQGNTVIVVEHDEETIRAADHLIDIGPGAGEHGGRVVAAGPISEIMKCPESITGKYLSGELRIPVPPRRKPDGRFLTFYGCSEHNLKGIDVKIPLGLFVCVTGVSGSGKSTLVQDIVYKRLARDLHGASERPGKHSSVSGLGYLDKVVAVDQSPIGRTPRSNPATYTGVFDLIRELFSLTPEARMRGYKPGRFSFNVWGGRCESCKGDGIIKVEMHFLPDVYVPCEVCRGKRYNRETLEIRYKGKTIADVLEMSVEQALAFFEPVPRVRRKLETLRDVGLGYIKLGQPAPTLSGGEAQRVKLAAELGRRSNGRTLYVLDEPTTGLHAADVHKLLQVLQRLVAAGDTVLVIEHNMDVIKSADYIIDLGPEGGDAGGFIVAEGTPEEVANDPRSYTGQFLRSVLKRAAEPSTSEWAGGFGGSYEMPEYQR